MKVTTIQFSPSGSTRKVSESLAIWTMVPFWTPRVFVKAAGFTRVGAGKVHRLQKR